MEDFAKRLGKPLHHMKGFEVTRKIVLSGADTDLPDILRELADVLDEVEMNDGDRMNMLSITYTAPSPQAPQQVTLTGVLVTAPKRDK